MKAPHFFEKTLNRLMIKNKMIVFLVPFILLSYLCMLFSVYFVFFKYTQDINGHYQENVGLADVSRQLGRNPSYVSRLIKECTGKNFTSLLTARRMEAAKHLLKNTNLKIAEIAEKTGYPNVRYFNRVFKTSMNMSANDYRSFTNAFES